VEALGGQPGEQLLVDDFCVHGCRLPCKPQT
jgi:hypothetical protein